MTSKISSGIGYLDHLLGFLKTGDNVIWEVEAGTYIEIFLQRFIEHNLKSGYKVVYVSFNVSATTLTKRLNYLPNLENLTILDCFTAGKGNNDPLFTQFYEREKEGFRGSVVKVENPKDLSQFRVALDRVEIEKGAAVRYLFDSLTGMQDIWGDENVTYKFFTYSCPRLYDLETVAYWVLEKEAHTPSFKANLRHITQVAIDLEKQNGELFFKVIKIEGRFSRSAFLPKHYEVWDREVIFPNTQPIYFLTDGDSGPLQKIVIKPGERQDIHLKEVKGTDVKLQLLVSDVLNRRMEPYLLTIKEGTVIDGHFYSHKGDEFAYVMEGELEVEIQDEKQLLMQGDSLYIGSTFPSKWVNVGTGDAVILWVLSPPRGGL